MAAEDPAAGDHRQGGDGEAAHRGGHDDLDQTSPCRAECDPLSVTTKAIGARNAGSVYLQACIIVGIALPPVIAAEATAASAVGGDTSESTA